MMIKEIYDLFKRLNTYSEIQRVMQLIEMPNDWRPSDSVNLYKVKTDIVNWAEQIENGEEYKLARLNKLKDSICDVIGYENLPANLCSKDTFRPEEFVRTLRLLDYKPHADWCQNLLELDNFREVAFLIQAPNKSVQKWLTERLVHYVPNSINADRYVIDFGKYVFLGIETFWNIFAKSAKTKDSNKFDIDDLAMKFAESCKDKNVIIIMQGWSYLKHEPGIINDIFNFWHKLVDELRLIDCGKHLVVLLLKADPQEYAEIFCVEDHESHFIHLNSDMIEEIKTQNQDTDFRKPRNIFLLPSMEKIEKKDVHTWFKKSEVLSCLKQNDQKYVDKVSRLIEGFFEKPAENVLDSICKYIFDLKDGLTEIEQAWEVRSNK